MIWVPAITLVGRSVPDFQLLDGTRDERTSASADAACCSTSTPAHLCRRWLLARTTGSTILLRTAGSVWGASAMLVRPDGIVAWACNGAPDVDGCCAGGEPVVWEACRARGRQLAAVTVRLGSAMPSRGDACEREQRYGRARQRVRSCGGASAIAGCAPRARKRPRFLPASCALAPAKRRPRLPPPTRAV